MQRLLSAVAAVTFATSAGADTTTLPPVFPTLKEHVAYILEAGVFAYDICAKQPTSETAMMFRFAGNKAGVEFQNYGSKLIRETGDPALVPDQIPYKIAAAKCDAHIAALQLRELSSD